MVSDEDLAFETHMGPYRRNGYLTGHVQRDAYWYFQAQDMHAMRVLDATRDLQSDILIVGQRLDNAPAYHHLVFGAARRSRMIWGAFRELYYQISPDRTEPLPHDDVFEAARALNDIYIHTRGTMDNYAWALLHLFGDEKLKNLHQSDIGLHRKKFRENPSVSEFGEIAAAFGDWESEIKERRDPVAHRIPLSVPPALLNDEDQAKYRALNDSANEALRQYLEFARGPAPQEIIDAASAKVDRLHSEMGKVGTFIPMIVHDPNEDAVRIYPTVPEDIGQLIKLLRRMNTRIIERLDQLDA
jgi:hypothetical protein